MLVESDLQRTGAALEAFYFLFFYFINHQCAKFDRCQNDKPVRGKKKNKKKTSLSSGTNIIEAITFVKMDCPCATGDTFNGCCRTRITFNWLV